MTITLHPGRVTLAELATIYWTGEAVRIDPSFDAGIEKAARRIAQIAAGNAPVYGINTGLESWPRSASIAPMSPPCSAT